MKAFAKAAAIGFCMVFTSLSCMAAQQSPVVAQWVQLTPGSGAEARVVTTAQACPDLTLDGHSAAMSERAVPDANFPVRICAAAIPSNAQSASVSGTPLPIPHGPAARILVIGDTGCRIKGSAVQACNDPKQWPFPALAAAAAKLQPDLVIHVGDYLYRESPCPAGNAGCAGSPFGDNWAAWNADFFAPAQPLLAAAPFVIVRGNHEDCTRAGPGWLRLLGPLPFVEAAPCIAHLKPYVVSLGVEHLVVMDDADAPDTSVDDSALPEYRDDFASLSGLAPKPLWVTMHRPIWGAVKLMGLGVGGNRTLIAALGDSHALDGVDFLLSGHIHAFEALNYVNNAPPQIIAGNSGDNLDSAPDELAGLDLGGQGVKDGMSLPGFGFLTMQRQPHGWKIDLYRVDGTVQGHCTLADRRLSCTRS